MNQTDIYQDVQNMRIGIMCNSLHFSAWEAETIRNLINTSGVSLELLIGNANYLDTPNPEEYTYLQKNHHLYSLTPKSL